jgi:hypothetical protein
MQRGEESYKWKSHEVNRFEGGFKKSHCSNSRKISVFPELTDHRKEQVIFVFKIVGFSFSQRK